MKGIIREGDRHSGGGCVLAGSTTRVLAGRGVARLGDPVSCPVHGKNRIAKVSGRLISDGVEVAVDGDTCACGCRLISSLTAVGLA
ncbi:PAAR domain-containing protein [Luteibacter sp.]|jgi:uncharacterized Zn-binding protein involved in type VI secretion|uniref:PAAR domain-containing protein n=1 Tax=Luteibacter sp. TaxID=1886636 RepID=UPI002F407889